MGGLISRVPLNLCPVCGTKLDAVTSIESMAKPNVGDITVCIKCAAVLRFDGELRLRAMTEREIRELHPDNFKDIARVQRIIILSREKRKP